MSVDATSQAIPKDLEDSYNAAKSLSLTHELLTRGTFSYFDLTKVTLALAFIKSLHEQTVTALIAHPESDLIEEIKQYKGNLNGSKEASSEGYNNIDASNGAASSSGETSSTL